MISSILSWFGFHLRRSFHLEEGTVSQVVWSRFLVVMTIELFILLQAAWIVAAELIWRSYKT